MTVKQILITSTFCGMLVMIGLTALQAYHGDTMIRAAEFGVAVGIGSIFVFLIILLLAGAE